MFPAPPRWLDPSVWSARLASASCHVGTYTTGVFWVARFADTTFADDAAVGVDVVVLANVSGS